MTVFIYTLKRLLRNKVMLLFFIILPLIAILPTTASTSQPASISIGVVNQDSTPFTKDLLFRLGKNFHIVKVKESEVKSNLQSAALTYAIVIPKSFTDDIINGKSPEISGYCLKEKDYSKVVGLMIDSFVTPSKQIASKVHGNSTAFYSAISKIPPAKSVKNKKDYKVPFALIIQFAFMSSIFAATVIIADKESKTFYRTFNSPVSIHSYMLQSILCFLLLSLSQVTVLYFAVVSIIGMNPCKKPGDMYILLFVVTVTSVSLGIAISSLSKSSTQATAIGLGIVVVMCMFGGAWGMTPTSPLMVGTAKIMPFYWAKDASDQLITGKALCSVRDDILILLGFAAVFFLAGTWRKSDIER